MKAKRDIDLIQWDQTGSNRADIRVFERTHDLSGIHDVPTSYWNLIPAIANPRWRKDYYEIYAYVHPRSSGKK
jgi:hypothetical protein